jgi:hypothetical protein
VVNVIINAFYLLNLNLRILPLRVLYFLQYLYGAQDDFIVNPFIFLLVHLFLVNFRGNENIFPSRRMHFLFFLLTLQQFFI